MPIHHKEKFVNDVLTILTRSTPYYYRNHAGQVIQGQAVSVVLTELRDYQFRWRGLPSGLGNFESMIEEAGFLVIAGSNARGNRCRIVTL
jgi:hypothetical protein